MTLLNLQRRCTGLLDGVKIVKILKRATVLHKGWEMDNELWLVKLSDDSTLLLGTNHGGICEVYKSELLEYISKTKKSLDSMYSILEEIK